MRYSSCSISLSCGWRNLLWGIRQIEYLIRIKRRCLISGWGGKNLRTTSIVMVLEMLYKQKNTIDNA